jgi:hypothetical protein
MVPLAVVPRPSAAAELVWSHCLFHAAPQYDPSEPAALPGEALVSPGDLHSA